MIECEFCGQKQRSADPTLHQYVAGWALANRKAGGVNAIRERTAEPRFACGRCIVARHYGAESQLTLFADDAIDGFPTSAQLT